jgi:hypothetical protein
MRSWCCIGKTLAVLTLCCGVAIAAQAQGYAGPEDYNLTTSGLNPTTPSTGNHGAGTGGGCADITLSQTVPPDADPNAGDGVACASGQCYTVENWYARSFDLRVGEPAGQDFTVKCVDFGVESNQPGDPNCGGGAGGPLTVQVRLYVDVNRGAPQRPGADLVLQGSTQFIVPDGAQTEVFTAEFNPPVTIPADSQLVVEWGHLTRNPANGGDGGLSWPGANGGVSQTAPSYLRAASCGLTNFATTDSIGFPQSRWILRVDGDVPSEPMGACCNDATGQCLEDQTRAECPMNQRWRPGEACGDLDPPCGEFNDECPAAELIECGSVTVVDNTGATQNLNDDPFVCSPDGQGQQPDRTLYYKFVATSTSATVSTCDTDQNGAANTILSMYGSCDVFVDELGCDHDRCDPHARLCVDGLTIGQEYIILVSESAGGAPGSITLNLDCAPECMPDPLGACCIAGGDLCFNMSEPDCRDNGGAWRGEGTACDDDPDPCARSCGTGEVLWDNGLNPNGVNGRAQSPPAFPNIRIVDDFVVPNGITWTIEDYHFNTFDDAGWTPGSSVEVYVRAHNPNTGGPVVGVGNELVNAVRTTYTRTATGSAYFGRDDYDTCVLFEEDSFQLPGGKYWIGSRNPNGGGSGTNYWATSDGGADGPASTGWFSLDGGATFNDEGPTWDHAFTVTGFAGEVQNGACCHGDGTCEDGVPGDQCNGEFDRFEANTLCDNLDPPCSETPGGCCIEGGGCIRNPEWQCDGDVDGDGQVNPVDSGLVQANFGSNDEQALCNYDMDCDGQINPVDSGIVQALFGSCNAPRDECGGGGGGGECVEVGPTECGARDGTFLGIGTDCADDPCGFATGACCVDSECVGTTREADCSGTWFEGQECPGFDCSVGPGCGWDNNIGPDGVNGRATSPPSFPDIRVVDDVTVSGCQITNLRLNMIEDAGWTPGANITVYVYANAGGQPQGGAPFATQTTTFTRTATGDQYFGRNDYNYTINTLAIPLPAGTYWVGSRNGNGGGAGTNYWMTSDGGADGGGSSTGYFSINAGATWEAEGAGWQHAFEMLP